MNRLPFAAQLCAVASLVAPAVAQNLSTELVATVPGSPLLVTSPADDARLFIVEQEGIVRILQSGVLLPTPFLDVSGLVWQDNFTGLRSFVFHPDFATNGYFYVSWDEDAGNGDGTVLDLVIDRYSVLAGDRNAADPASRIELLRLRQDSPWHGAGHMQFGPDGMFYVATGDGFGIGGGDQVCNAQNGSVLWGKMLRLDVDGALPYTIPPDNPFVGDPSVLDEIWLIGFRHPWRWSFDRATGDLWIGDVGESIAEEINFQPAGTSGSNFGWQIMQGTSCSVSTNCPATALPCNDPGYTPPFYEYSHDGGGCSVTGGFVYRGHSIPSLYGRYVFADYCTGAVQSFQPNGSSFVGLTDHSAEMGGTFFALTSFGEDADGELYFTTQGGEVRRIVARCGAAEYCVAAPNSTGTGASIGWSGTVSVPANTFTVEVSDSPPSQPGVFFYGANQASVPFGDGIRCVGGTFFRLDPPVVSDANGAASRLVDFSSPPANAGAGEITVASTWFFQYWYRDPGGPGANGFNLSSGLSALFCP